MTPSIERRMSGAEWGLMLVLSLLWGGSFLFIRIAVTEVPPLTLVLVRVALAAAALWPVILLLGIRLPRDPRLWAAFLGMGMLNNLIPFSLLMWGQQHMTTGAAAVLNATTPIWTTLLAHLLTQDERLRPRKLVGIGLGLLGVVIMVGPSALGGLGDNLLAQLAMLAAAVSYGFAGIFGRRFKNTPPLLTAAGQLTMTSLVLFPALAFLAPPWDMAMPGTRVVVAVVALALVSTALAYILFFRILAGAGASNAALVTLLVPVSAMILGGLVLGESITGAQLAGMVAIGLGLAAIDGRPLAWAQRRWVADDAGR